MRLCGAGGDRGGNAYPLIYVGLLRAINVGGRRLKMDALRVLAAASGWHEPETLGAAGSVVFSSSHEPDELAANLRATIAAQVGMVVDVVVLAGDEVARVVGSCPWANEPDAGRRAMWAASQWPVGADAAATLAQRCNEGEQVTVVDGALWIWFGSGQARSELTSPRLNRAAGQPVTTRNLNTCQSLVDRAVRRSAGL